MIKSKKSTKSLHPTYYTFGRKFNRTNYWEKENRRQHIHIHKLKNRNHLESETDINIRTVAQDDICLLQWTPSINILSKLKALRQN